MQPRLQGPSVVVQAKPNKYFIILPIIHSKYFQGQNLLTCLISAAFLRNFNVSLYQ